MLPKNLQNKLDKRAQENAFRQLGTLNHLIDFSSNDYLGFSKSEAIFKETHLYVTEHKLLENGSTGSRLLTGNHKLYNIVEQQISAFHSSETALIFNSGYNANLGFFSSVPQRNDIILYDELCHASIRDGIKMSNAKAYKFNHNDLEDLECHLERSREVLAKESNIYIVTESVFSMDGDSPDLKALSKLAKKHNDLLIIDEAHAIGVFCNCGKGLISKLNLEASVFTRIITFGKALGTHGAAILCHQDLKEYLVNFSRPFIYTTALPPHNLATIQSAYNALNTQEFQLKKLRHNITFFKTEIARLKLQHHFIESNSAIHCCVVSGNKKAKHIAQELQHNGFDVKAILSPTVPKGKERLRFCIHSFNTEKEISEVLHLLTTFAL
ncbi:aminotransferase class I/II-fold pyridoxal phosphate-dependent enzyme [Psychroserpens mesophilus]|uniref:aminotransferase class I/II-fold pyridoxal phosphate-dependent enzyme n=1 Tax=Psychroserpens mesophilus TaxID=325473 RepID=UPI003D64C464